MKSNNTIMPSKDVPVREAKQYKSCTVMMNQWGIQLNTSYHVQQWWTSETSQTIRCKNDNEPVKPEVKQCKLAH